MAPGAGSRLPCRRRLCRRRRSDSMESGESEKRRAPRFRAGLHVRANGAAGITRDVSESGIFFETDASYATGSSINLSIDVDTPGGRIRLAFRGSIVRVERRANRVGVAVKIGETTIAPAEVADPPAA